MAIEISKLKKEMRSLRKKLNRIEESRSLLKEKYSKKGKIIKTYQDRLDELENSRNNWKIKNQSIKIKLVEMEGLLKQQALQSKILNEQLKKVTVEYDNLKKKYQ